MNGERRFRARRLSAAVERGSGVRRRLLAAGLALAVWVVAQPAGLSQQPAPALRPGEAPAGWEAAWVEPDFPFFSSVIDARAAGSPFPGDNLSPRALVLNLGHGHWVAFDTDLVRVAAAWKGRGVTPVALAPGSYHVPNRKTPGGQDPSPQPDGSIWTANGIYPGWQIGARPSFDDPREPAPSPEEVGRGPLPEPMARVTAVRQVRGGTVIESTVGGTPVREWFTVSDADRPRLLERHIEIGPSADTLWLAIGIASPDISVAIDGGTPAAATLETIAMTPAPPARAGDAKVREPAVTQSVRAVRIAPHEDAVRFTVALSDGSTPPAVTRRAIPGEPPAPRWPQEVRTRVSPSKKQAAYVVDDVELPRRNPFRRLVRASDVQFLPDGTGVMVTLDGDVWLARGLHEPAGPVRWRRFASGLHEPLTLATRDGEIHVFDRNGIWRLRDTNGDGEADVHELFSNAFAQTADMREFPNTIRLAPGGEFVIAKGGQEATTIGKHNGSVLRISADGRRATVLGYGLRQPNLGVNARTGLVTASDQQGHYVPSTPLHVIRDRQFYGFISTRLPPEVYPAPIADPLTWIPHAVNASAMSQVWLFGARMGPLDDALVHIGYNRPELFRVLLNGRGKVPQAAVVSITHDFDFPPLNGSVNPADGQLYLAGFQILGWGTTATRLAGLGRVRYTGAPSTVPRDIVPMDAGVLLRFDVELDGAKASDPASYTVASWHYRRTHKYGSPQLKADGTPGVDRLAPSAAHLSTDRRSVFVAVPGMAPVMQMQVGWSLATAAGVAFEETASFTPYELTPFDPGAEGFGDVTIRFAPPTPTATGGPPAKGPVSAAEGRAVYERIGCMACHANDRSTPDKLGPSLAGLYGASRTFADGSPPATADEAYLREAILEPATKIVAGYDRNGIGMPSYAGVLTDAQIESVILYIKSLR